jgi:hypothetical protein
MMFAAMPQATSTDSSGGGAVVLFLLPGIGHLALGLGASEVDRANLAPGVGLNAT